MRTVIVAALLLAAANGLVVDKKPFVTREMVDAINQQPGMTWQASMENGRVKGATLQQIRGMLGSKRVKLPEGTTMRKFTEKEMNIKLPDEFDSATNWPQCKTIPHIYDQSDCGSCWAIAAAGAISDRYCTTSNRNEFYISTRDLLSCCTSCGSGCNGGFPMTAWSYWVETGLVSDTCEPYPFPHCDHHTTGKYPPCGSGGEYPTPSCASTCTANSSDVNMTRYRGSSNYGVSGEDDYKRELNTNGPFEVAFSVFGDFVTYKSGVYQHKTGDSLGGHAVRIVGYGELNGVKYWKIANSWNEDWALDGYFLIKRGDDECGIESSGVAGKV